MTKVEVQNVNAPVDRVVQWAVNCLPCFWLYTVKTWRCEHWNVRRNFLQPKPIWEVILGWFLRLFSSRTTVCDDKKTFLHLPLHLWYEYFYIIFNPLFVLTVQPSSGAYFWLYFLDWRSQRTVRLNLSQIRPWEMGWWEPAYSFGHKLSLLSPYFGHGKPNATVYPAND